uniref:Uncharacterized protein n=1 Tax=Cacopsylla melanoneura TaxID=428564 RepID=A0A8D8VZ67_9HEMI
MGEDYDKGAFKRANRDEIMDMIKNQAVNKEGCIDPEAFKTLTPSKYLTTHDYKRRGTDYEDREEDRDAMEIMKNDEHIQVVTEIKTTTLSAMEALKRFYVTNMQVTDKTTNRIMDALKEVYEFSLKKNQDKNGRKRRELTKDVPNNDDVKVYRSFKKDQQDLMKREFKNREIEKLTFRRMYSGGPLFKTKIDDKSSKFGGVRDSNIKGHALKHRAKRQEPKNRTKSWASCWQSSLDRNESPPEELAISMFTPHQYSLSKEELFSIGSDLSKYYFVPTPKRTTKLTTLRKLKPKTVADLNEEMAFEEGNRPHTRITRMVYSLKNSSSQITSKETFSEESSSSSQITTDHNWEDFYDYSGNYDSNGVHKDSHNRTAVKLRVKREYFQYSNQREYLSQFPPPSGSYFVRQKAVRKAQKSRLFFKNMSVDALNALADKATNEINDEINNGFDNIDSTEARHVYMGVTPFNVTFRILPELPKKTTKLEISTDKNEEFDARYEISKDDTNTSHKTIYKKDLGKSPEINTVCHQNITESHESQEKDIGAYDKEIIKNMCYANPEFLTTESAPEIIASSKELGENAGHFPSTILFRDKIKTRYNPLDGINIGNDDLLSNENNMKDNKYVRLQNYTILPKQFDNHGKRSYDLYKKIKYHFEREHRPLTEVPSNTKYRILRKESIEQKRIEENIKNSLSNIKEIETSIVLHPPFVYPVNTTNENNKHVTYYQRFRSIEQMKEFKNKEDIIHMRNLPLLHHVKLFTKNGLLYKEIEKFRFVKKADTHEVQYMGNNFEAVQKYLEEVRNTPKTKRYEFHTNTITVSNETKKYNVTRYIYLNKTKTTYTENKSKYFYKTNSKFTHLAKNPYSFYTMFEKLTRKKKPQYVFVDITKKDERSKDIEVSEETKATTPTTTLSKYKFTDTTQKDESSKETKPTTTVSKYKFIDITQKDASGKKGTPTTAWSKYIFIDIRSTGLYYDRVYKYQDKNGLSRTRPSTSAPTKYIFVHKTGVHEPFNEKIKILRELQIHTDTLKCHNFSMDDLLLLKRLRYNKRNNISLTILDNQILEFFDRPELSATRPTVSTTYQFHLTYDDDEYIDETTTTHVDTDERNERFDIEEDEMNPGLYPVDHTTTKLKRKEYIELLRMKLKKDGNRQDTTLEKSLIDKFNNRLRRSIVEDRHAENITNIGDVNSTDMRGRYDNYDERRKRDITFQIREKYNRGNIRKQYSGGVLENNVEESLIDGMKRNIRNKRNIKHHHKHNSSETFEHKARQIKDKIESIKQKRHTYPRDESFQQEDLFKSFELITPRKKHNQTVDYKWSISEPNNESFEYYSKSESVKGSDYPEPEESVNSVISDPFKVFRHTFPSGSVMDPREFSTRGTTSGIRWENKPFDNFEEYDISKKMVKTRRPFDIHYFDEEIAREDELIRKGLLTTTTYRTPEPVDKNEMYSFSDEKSKELCRVWVTSDVVSNIMEKYKLTSTRSVKELLRYTHFYKMWKKNQTKPTTSTTTMFNEWAVYRHKRALGENYCPKYEDNENQAEEHKDWGVTRNLDTVLKLYTNRIKIVFDPNQSYEEIDPRFFTKKPKCEDTSVEQTNSPGSRIPSNIVKREKKDGVTMRPRNLSREYVDAVKRDKDFFIEITTRNVRKHLSGRLGKVRKIKQKKHEDENRCLVLPNSLRVIKTEKKLRVFKDFIIVKDGITTDPYKRKKAFENPKDQTRDPIQKNDANEIPTRPQDKEFADQLQQHKWTFIREESTKKYRSLKDIILNKTEDDILYKGWLEYKKNMMNTHERFRRDLDGTDEILYRTPRPKKNYGMLFDGRSTRKIRDYRAYLKVYTRPSAMRSKYYVLQEKKEKYIENNTDYEEYRKRYDAKIAEIDVNKPEDPVVFEKYFQKLSPEYNARTVGGQLLFNENIRYELENTTIDSTRKKERLLKILTECMPKSNPYYTDRNIYNESEWKRYAVMLDDSRINDRYVAEELERRPTFSPLLITQVYEVKNKRQKRDLDNKEIGDKDIHSAKYMTNHKKNKREADHNWSIFERTAPSDPPDDNFDWNTITPFPTEKPKRPGRTPYADSAICNDPDSADTEENRQKFETEMRDFFGSDIETMTEIAKERERIRENFIKQLEDKERNEKEAKEKNEGHSKKATTIRHKYSGGIMNNRAKKENFADIENKYIINENKKKMKRDTRDKQRIREIYGEYDYVETSTMQPLKKGMLTKDPLEHGQYLNFYQHLMKYNQSLFGKYYTLSPNKEKLTFKFKFYNSNDTRFEYNRPHPIQVNIKKTNFFFDKGIYYYENNTEFFYPKITLLKKSSRFRDNTKYFKVEQKSPTKGYQKSKVKLYVYRTTIGYSIHYNDNGSIIDIEDFDVHGRRQLLKVNKQVIGEELTMDTNQRSEKGKPRRVKRAVDITDIGLRSMINNLIKRFRTIRKNKSEIEEKTSDNRGMEIILETYNEKNKQPEVLIHENNIKHKISVRKLQKRSVAKKNESIYFTSKERRIRKQLNDEFHIYSSETYDAMEQDKHLTKYTQSIGDLVKKYDNVYNFTDTFEHLMFRTNEPKHKTTHHTILSKATTKTMKTEHTTAHIDDLIEQRLKMGQSYIAKLNKKLGISNENDTEKLDLKRHIKKYKTYKDLIVDKDVTPNMVTSSEGRMTFDVLTHRWENERDRQRMYFKDQNENFQAEEKWYAENVFYQQNHTTTPNTAGDNIYEVDDIEALKRKLGLEEQTLDFLNEESQTNEDFFTVNTIEEGIEVTGKRKKRSVDKGNNQCIPTEIKSNCKKKVKNYRCKRSVSKRIRNSGRSQLPSKSSENSNENSDRTRYQKRNLRQSSSISKEKYIKHYKRKHSSSSSSSEESRRSYRYRKRYKNSFGSSSSFERSRKRSRKRLAHSRYKESHSKELGRRRRRPTSDSRSKEENKRQISDESYKEESKLDLSELNERIRQEKIKDSFPDYVNQLTKLKAKQLQLESSKSNKSLKRPLKTTKLYYVMDYGSGQSRDISLRQRKIRKNVIKINHREGFLKVQAQKLLWYKRLKAQGTVTFKYDVFTTFMEGDGVTLKFIRKEPKTPVGPQQIHHEKLKFSAQTTDGKNELIEQKLENNSGNNQNYPNTITPETELDTINTNNQNMDEASMDVPNKLLKIMSLLPILNNKKNIKHVGDELLNETYREYLQVVKNPKPLKLKLSSVFHENPHYLNSNTRVTNDHGNRKYLQVNTKVPYDNTNLPSQTGITSGLREALNLLYGKNETALKSMDQHELKMIEKLKSLNNMLDTIIGNDTGKVNEKCVGSDSTENYLTKLLNVDKLGDLGSRNERQENIKIRDFFRNDSLGTYSTKSREDPTYGSLTNPVITQCTDTNYNGGTLKGDLNSIEKTIKTEQSKCTKHITRRTLGQYKKDINSERRPKIYRKDISEHGKNSMTDNAEDPYDLSRNGIYNLLSKELAKHKDDEECQKALNRLIDYPNNVPTSLQEEEEGKGKDKIINNYGESIEIERELKKIADGKWHPKEHKRDDIESSSEYRREKARQTYEDSSRSRRKQHRRRPEKSRRMYSSESDSYKSRRYKRRKMYRRRSRESSGRSDSSYYERRRKHRRRSHEKIKSRRDEEYDDSLNSRSHKKRVCSEKYDANDIRELLRFKTTQDLKKEKPFIPNDMENKRNIILPDELQGNKDDSKGKIILPEDWLGDKLVLDLKKQVKSSRVVDKQISLEKADNSFDPDALPFDNKGKPRSKSGYTRSKQSHEHRYHKDHEKKIRCSYERKHTSSEQYSERSHSENSRMKIRKNRGKVKNQPRSKETRKDSHEQSSLGKLKTKHKTSQQNNTKGKNTTVEAVNSEYEAEYSDGIPLGEAEYPASEDESGSSGEELDPRDPNFSDHFKKPFVKKPDIGTVSDFKEELKKIPPESYETRSYIDYNESNDNFDSEYIDKKETIDPKFGKIRTPKYLPGYFLTLPKGHKLPRGRRIGMTVRRKDLFEQKDKEEEERLLNFIPEGDRALFTDPYYFADFHNRLIDDGDTYDEGFQKFILENHKIKDEMEEIKRNQQFGKDKAQNFSTTTLKEYVEIQPKLNKEFKRYRLLLKMMDTIMNKTNFNQTQLSRNHQKMYTKLKEIVSVQKYVRSSFYRWTGTSPLTTIKSVVKTTKFYLKYLNRFRPFQVLGNVIVTPPNIKIKQKTSSNNPVDSLYDYLMT